MAAKGRARPGSRTFAWLIVATLLGTVPWVVFAVAESFYSGPPPGPPTNAPCDSGILGCWDWGDLHGTLRQWLPAVAACASAAALVAAASLLRRAARWWPLGILALAGSGTAFYLVRAL